MATTLFWQPPQRPRILVEAASTAVTSEWSARGIWSETEGAWGEVSSVAELVAALTRSTDKVA